MKFPHLQNGLKMIGSYKLDFFNYKRGHGCKIIDIGLVSAILTMKAICDSRSLTGVFSGPRVFGSYVQMHVKDY